MNIYEGIRIRRRAERPPAEISTPSATGGRPDDQYGMILKRPMVLGHEMAGIIVKLGQGVSDPKVGERVVTGIPTRPVSDQSL
ncbi:hypothetical protein ETB97_010221 [Aspergillus alliaceus]|uniref:Alcohol dehydrogenase-like N-terminal domain-containing protein n=1 Tax=Petromyces alliaceus TaxID=209559 RepID=A0A8H6E8H9_PETAA|nr:hypothetical protein ETB97_010221 [Aspergillus burnettii]